MKMPLAISSLFLATSVIAATPETGADAARRYRVANEQKIVGELLRFLSIPNVASDTPNIEKNAAAIVEMFARRGIEARLLRVSGAPPLVVADVRAPRAKRTIAFYAHYDGQPVDPSKWDTDPWVPVEKEGRIYARSASDDKSPIVALLAALDALKAANIKPSVNLKFVFEGEEEAGSPHLDQYLEKFAADLSPDAWIMCDGPVHQSRRPLLFFGVRGVTGGELTVYGPSRALHSGHYGNWAPNPIVMLTGLIASMRNDEGRILIDGYYDDVQPVSDAERAALARAPAFDDEIQRELALGRTEGEAVLNERILQPALNLRGISGGNVGERASNSIPAEAHASFDLRLVPSQSPERVQQLVERHITKQGFFIVRDTPDAATRMAHPKIAKVIWGHGYPAARTAMDLPISRDVIRVATAATGGEPVLLPSLGGSIPIHLFQRGGRVPVIGVPIVNHDNNQHAANENLRLQNLWDGIELYAALFAGL
ncbi:MAG TPA: M20/M25/M40 family metallo-hydrolase [Thermoanaerobaculia bacterium]|nr:M20/M25/M40 family metallo-hydrolase [Thermoanaerobaculia bacterium]